MTEENKKQIKTEQIKNTQAEKEQEVKQGFVVQKIYTKNISFESPNTPEVFLKEFKPELEVNINIESKIIEDNVHNVILRVTATIKVDSITAFLCEVEQAGIFAITGFDDANLQYLLAVQCPNVLFPFAREAVSDLVTKGGFPQLLLEPINFESMYVSHMQQTQDATAESADALKQ